MLDILLYASKNECSFEIGQLYYSTQQLRVNMSEFSLYVNFIDICVYELIGSIKSIYYITRSLCLY